MLIVVICSLMFVNPLFNFRLFSAFCQCSFFVHSCSLIVCFLHYLLIMFVIVSLMFVHFLFYNYLLFCYSLFTCHSCSLLVCLCYSLFVCQLVCVSFIFVVCFVCFCFVWFFNMVGHCRYLCIMYIYYCFVFNARYYR